MYYSRRWFYAGCFVVIVMGIGYFSDLQYLLEQYTKLLQAERKLRAELVVHHSADSGFSLDQSVAPESQYLPSLFGLLQKNHIDVVSVFRVVHHEGLISGAEEYHLVLRGKYVAIRHLFFDFMNQSHSFSIKKIMLESDSHQYLQVELTLRMQEQTSVSGSGKVTLQDDVLDPFCGMERRGSGKKSAIYYSLQDVQLLGFVSRHQLRYAIIRFPDGVVMELGEGMRLGKEGGRIIKINTKTMTVMMPDQTYFVL